MKKFPVWVDGERYMVKIREYRYERVNCYDYYDVFFYKNFLSKYKTTIRRDSSPVADYIAIVKEAMEKFEKKLEKEKLQQQENEKFYAWDGRK